MPKVIDSFKDEYAFLSNFYASPILHDDILYPTNEHFFQAMKTKDVDVRKQIALVNFPSQAKKMGNDKKLVKIRSDWEDIKLKVMMKGLKMKFEIPALRTMLFSTGEAKLIEGNFWKDTYWGVCNGEGENKLGKLLMKLRSQLCDER